MQIIPNRRKDRILIRIDMLDTVPWKALHDVDARPCKPLPTPTPGDLRDFIARTRWPNSMRRSYQPFMLSVPVTTKTKAEMARKLRAKFKGLNGTIKWERGKAS